MTPVRRLDIGRLIGHLNCTSTVGHDLINIERVSDIIGAISSAGIEQRVSVVQVGEAVSQVDQGTQPSAALVEECAAAAESPKDQARTLVQAVAVFKLSADADAARG